MNPQQSSALWEAQAEASGKRERWVAALLSWDWWCLPKGESRCSGAGTPSDPAHTGVPVSYVLLACSSPDQQLLWRTACACECVCVRGRERERDRERIYGLGHASRSNPSMEKNLTILRYSIMRVFRKVIFDF